MLLISKSLMSNIKFRTEIEAQLSVLENLIIFAMVPKKGSSKQPGQTTERLLLPFLSVPVSF